MVKIKIVEKNGKLEPEGARKTKVKRGESVRFEVAAGLTGVSIVFDTESPFGDKPEDKIINYGEDRVVTTGVAKLYVYTCLAKKGNEGLPTGVNGGEIEVGT